MDSSTLTVVIGLGGLLATVATSALGLYFTARARTSNLREHLYVQQLELVTSVMSVLGRIRVYSVLLDSEEFRDQAQEDLRLKMRELSELEEEAAAILPVELYAAIRSAGRRAIEIAESHDKGCLDESTFALLAASMAKLGLITRTYLGVEELSTESARLFGTKNTIKNLSEIDEAELLPSTGESRQSR